MLTLFAVVFGVCGSAYIYRVVRQIMTVHRLAIKGTNGIEDVGFVPIGGIDQWIQIRGTDASKPLLLLIHGGPGVSYVPFTECFRSWEERFVVVLWDQRGAGKTFGRNLAVDNQPLTVEQMVQDGLEVAEHLVKRFGGRKIVLVGHSWGTVLGARMATLRPDLFAVYFGVGQVADMAEAEQVTYRMLAQRLRDGGNKLALSKLESAGPPPYSDIRKWMVKQRLIVMTSPPPKEGKLPDILTVGLFVPGYSLRDSLNWYRSFTRSTELLFETLMRYDAREGADRFEIPIGFLQGENDAQTPTDCAKRYLEDVEAPTKTLTIFEGEGHTIIFSSPDLILREMLRLMGCS